MKILNFAKFFLFFFSAACFAHSSKIFANDLQINYKFNNDSKYNFVFEERRFGEIKYIVNHFTATHDLSETIKAFLKNETSAHYIIDESGKIFSITDEKRKAYHAGKSIFQNDFGLNETSIGIEHINLGFIEKKNQILNKKEQENQICIIFNATDKIFMNQCKSIKKIFLQEGVNGLTIHDKKALISSKNSKSLFFTKFSEKQIASSIWLNKYLMNKYKIKACNVVAHSDIGFPYLRKKDPGPLFPYKLFAKNGIGLWPSESDLENAKANLPKKVFEKSQKEKVKWFVKKLIDFGWHDPIYSYYSCQNQKYEKYNLKLNCEMIKYENQVRSMITAYNLHYRPEKGLCDQIDQKDLLIIYSLNILKNQGGN